VNCRLIKIEKQIEALETKVTNIFDKETGKNC
jgi:hypothetical protein